MSRRASSSWRTATACCSGGRRRKSALPPPTGDAHALKVAEGSPLLTLDCVVYAIDGRPIEWRVARCHLQDNHYFAEIN